jgi:hypothetical protein
MPFTLAVMTLKINPPPFAPATAPVFLSETEKIEITTETEDDAIATTDRTL